jgi:3-carboxy-cis,cis-muconate cycloisomerase
VTRAGDAERSATALDCIVLGNLFASEEVRRLFDSRRLVQSWLDAERALARAEAEVGVIPVAAAERIAREAQADRFDLEALGAEVEAAQHPLVPLVRALAEHCGEEAGAYVHWGATTQDIMDTGLVLQIRMALEPIRRDLRGAVRAAATLSREHRDLPMAGRTHGQHAVPITFGLKVATWADELVRCDERLESSARLVATAQLGGAAGTLASLGEHAIAVRRAFCRELDLAEAEVPWHATRDRIRDLGHALAEMSAAAERIGGEIVRLQATEAAELAEPSGEASVGSSTMPQKRNPMTSEYLVASARLLRGAVKVLFDAPAHAGERDMGLWATEWMAIPQALILAGGTASKLAAILQGLVVDGDRMRANLELTRGGVLAEAAMMELASAIGHERAHALVSAISRRAAAAGMPLAAALREDATARTHLPAAALDRLGRPESYLGAAGEIVDGAVARAERRGVRE